MILTGVFCCVFFLSSNAPVLGFMVHWCMFKKIALSLCFSLFLGLLSACSPDGILHLKNAESNAKENAKTSPSEQKNPGIGAPVALPPSYEKTPFPSASAQNPSKSTNGLDAFKPMKGVNVDALFAENIKDTDKRFDRVEDAVVDLRKEFEVYKPAIVRLSAVESDIQGLVKELEVLLQETPANQQPIALSQANEPSLQVGQIDPQPEPPPEPQVRSENKPPPQVKAPPPNKANASEAPPPAKTYSGIVAQNLRVGEHADKLRIVLDTNKSTGYRIDLDNDEKLIIIELPDARWVGGSSHSYTGSKLLDSYTVEPINDGKGSMIVIALRKTTSILQENKLTPDSTSAYHRIYFDLKL